MSKKHFRKLAYMLAKCEPENVRTAESAVWYACVASIMQVCWQCNPRFQRSIFLAACHLDYWRDRKLPE